MTGEPAIAAALASRLGVSTSAAQRGQSARRAERQGRRRPRQPGVRRDRPRSRREPGPAGRRPGCNQAKRGRVSKQCRRPRVPRIMDHVRVLAVDDDAAVRQSLSTALGRDGYEVLAANGGNAALAHMAATSVDAIVLDVAMAEPNGLEVLFMPISTGNPADTAPSRQLLATAPGTLGERVDSTAGRASRARSSSSPPKHSRTERFGPTTRARAGAFHGCLGPPSSATVDARTNP
jgi:CheY-like chemotaxis protein